MLSVEQVRSFVVVAEERHFGRAAARLNMTQPPLSRQIQKLEDEIGVRLLERNARGVRLTPAGAAFLEDARRLVRLTLSAPEAARRVAAGWSGPVRMGFTLGCVYQLLGDFLHQMTIDLPDVRLELSEMVTARQMEALADGDIDLGLARPPFDAAIFDSMPVRRERLAVALPAAHRLASLDRAITADDLAGEDFIMHSPTQARYFYDITAAVLAGRHFNTVQTAGQLLTIVSLVGCGLGVALVPDVTRRLGIEGVRFAELKDAPAVEVHAVWLKDARSPVLPRLRTVLARLADDAG